MDVKHKLEVMREIEEANKRHLQEWKDHQEEGKILAVFVDVYGPKKCAEKVYIRRDIDEYHRLLQCTVLDMPFRWIGGKPFVIICDDEGTFREDCRVSARNGNEIMLVGNLFVVAFDGNEDIRGLTPDEADHVMQHTERLTGLCMTASGIKAERWTALRDVTYTQNK